MGLQSLIDRLSEWDLPMKDKVFVAGPCSVESEDQMLETAAQLAPHEVTILRGGIWKPRTRPGSFEGIGVQGLPWLKNAGNLLGVPVTTEVANPLHVEASLKAGIDILWIGARTTTDPFAVQEIADALQGVDIPVMIKNPMNPDLELWVGALERIAQAGITKIMAVHRGFSTYRENLYRNQPIWRIPIELRRRMPGLPLVCDPSHICGRRKNIRLVAQEAMDYLFDGLMIEVHCSPRTALSDAQQQLTPRQYADLLKKLQRPSSNDHAELAVGILADLRKEIDAIDDDVIALLAKRMEVVAQIGAWKRHHNVSLFQPTRWDHVLHNRIQMGLRRHLPERFVRGLFEQIHEHALNIQGERSTNGGPRGLKSINAGVVGKQQLVLSGGRS